MPNIPCVTTNDIDWSRSSVIDNTEALTTDRFLSILSNTNSPPQRNPPDMPAPSSSNSLSINIGVRCKECAKLITPNNVSCYVDGYCCACEYNLSCASAEYLRGKLNDYSSNVLDNYGFVKSSTEVSHKVLFLGLEIESFLHVNRLVKGKEYIKSFLSAVNNWGIVCYDSSLQGDDSAYNPTFEFKLPPKSLSIWRRDLPKVARFLNKSTGLYDRVKNLSNAHFGIHVHVGMYSTSRYVDVINDDVRYFISQFCNDVGNESYLTRLAGRSFNSYCIADPQKKIQQKSSVVNNGEHHQIYVPRTRKGTSEFRLFQSHAKPNTIMTYLEFAHALTRYALHHHARINTHCNWEKFVEWVETQSKYPKLQRRNRQIQATLLHSVDVE